MYSAKIIADSIAANSTARLTTMEICFPRIVLAEFNTHRMLSRNSASSRAIPVERRIRDVRANPFVPEAFGRNQKGMQAGEALGDAEQQAAEVAWRNAMMRACDCAEDLVKAGVHKQWANRLVEPFAWHTVVVTATEWTNYFNLRISKLAQPEIRRVSELMLEAMNRSRPEIVESGGWHLPYVTKRDLADLAWDDLPKVSTARCARVSYLTQDGRHDPDADIALANKLLADRHMSPFEHPAQMNRDHAWGYGEFIGNFREPWLQYRKTIAGEDVAPKET